MGNFPSGTTEAGGTRGREDGDMYSVSSSFSEGSPGVNFGTSNGLGRGRGGRKRKRLHNPSQRSNGEKKWQLLTTFQEPGPKTSEWKYFWLPRPNSQNAKLS